MIFKFKLFSSAVDGDMEEYEELMTRAYSNGEINVVQKETKLTESGMYMIAVHWLEESTNNDKDRATLNNMVRDGV